MNNLLVLAVTWNRQVFNQGIEVGSVVPDDTFLVELMTAIILLFGIIILWIVLICKSSIIQIFKICLP